MSGAARHFARWAVLLVLLSAAGLLMWQHRAKRVEPTASGLNLAKYDGKVVLLDFWASWCAPCREEVPQLIMWQNKYGARGLQVIGVAMDDDPKAAAAFQREFKINYPVIAGSPDIAAQYGGILGLPVNIVVARQGKVAAKHVGLTDFSVLEQEILTQLTQPAGSVR